MYDTENPIMTIKKWRICADKVLHPQYDALRIEHLCAMSSVTPSWRPWSYSVEYIGQVCCYCKESASDEIRTVFIFMKEK
jgi:hypothetical protein